MKNMKKHTYIITQVSQSVDKERSRFIELLPLIDYHKPRKNTSESHYWLNEPTQTLLCT